MNSETTKGKQLDKKPFYKKWWFWVIIVVLLFMGIGASSEKESTSDTNGTSSQTSEQQNTSKKYELIGGITGEYGKAVILNADTDSPVTKYLYKLPAGKYKVTTNNQKYSSFLS